MIKIGLTGSIAMGKSTVAAMFAQAGIPVFDSDAEVRALQAPGGQLEGAIVEAFPNSAGANGKLDRALLADLVVGDPQALKWLEALVHPAVTEGRTAFLAAHRDSPAVLFDIPLLYETGAEHHLDKVIVVSAPGEIQHARAMARPGMTEAKLAAILTRQMPDREKTRRADFVIDTSGDLSTTKAQVHRILACLGLEAA